MQGDSSSSPSTAKWALILALITAAACLALMAVRMTSVFSFAEPLHVTTSGWEQEGLLAMWSYLNDQPIYVSRFDIPYRWAIYNWLFYAGFATIVNTVIQALSLSDLWLPTVARLITVVALPVGIIGAMRGYALFAGPARGQMKWLYLASAVLLIAGPLMGFWGMTARPDPWAMVLEIWGIVFFWSLYRSQPLRAVLIFCLFAYLAWALKQSNIGALGGVGLFLLLKRDWRGLAILASVMAGAVGGTLVLGSKAYLTSITLSEYKSVWTISHSIDVITKFGLKTAPFIFGAAMVVGAVALRPDWKRQAFADDGFLLIASGALSTLSIAVLASFQPGSADHYFFLASFFLSLMALWGVRQAREIPMFNNWFTRVWSVGWGLQAIAIAAVLFGFRGVLSVEPTHQNLVEAKRCADQLPRPLYASDMNLSLPWMTPGTPSFVLAFGYAQDRAAGRKFERGGVGGLIEEGYFNALILPPQLRDRYDGGSLAQYRLTDRSCGKYRVHLKVGDNG
jgi:hypothetical protein